MPDKARLAQTLELAAHERGSHIVAIRAGATQEELEIGDFKISDFRFAIFLPSAEPLPDKARLAQTQEHAALNRWSHNVAIHAGATQEIFRKIERE